jgi:hypothetical protein
MLFAQGADRALAHALDFQSIGQGSFDVARGHAFDVELLDEGGDPVAAAD